MAPPLASRKEEPHHDLYIINKIAHETFCSLSMFISLTLIVFLCFQNEWACLAERKERDSVIIIPVKLSYQGEGILNCYFAFMVLEPVCITDKVPVNHLSPITDKVPVNHLLLLEQVTHLISFYKKNNRQ